MIEGSYEHLGTRLHTYNRVVISGDVELRALPGAVHRDDAGRPGRRRGSPDVVKVIEGSRSR